MVRNPAGGGADGAFDDLSPEFETGCASGVAGADKRRRRGLGLVHRDDDPRAKQLKRQKAASNFFASGNYHDELLRASAVYRPVRGLLSEFFKTKRQAPQWPIC